MINKLCNIKRSVVLKLDEGEDLLLSITKCVQDNDIKTASFTAIGGLKTFVHGIYNGKGYNTHKMEASCCLELVSAVGNVTLKEGKPFVHCHILVTDEKSSAAFGGHLMEGTIVYPMAEVFIHEYDVDIKRVYDPQIELWPIK